MLRFMGRKESDMTERLIRSDYIYNYIYNFSYFWLCWVFVAAHRFSLVAVSKGSSLVAVRKLLTAVASLEEEHGL